MCVCVCACVPACVCPFVRPDLVCLGRNMDILLSGHNLILLNAIVTLMRLSATRNNNFDTTKVVVKL